MISLTLGRLVAASAFLLASWCDVWADSHRVEEPRNLINQLEPDMSPNDPVLVALQKLGEEALPAIWELADSKDPDSRQQGLLACLALQETARPLTDFVVAEAFELGIPTDDRQRKGWLFQELAKFLVLDGANGLRMLVADRSARGPKSLEQANVVLDLALAKLRADRKLESFLEQQDAQPESWRDFLARSVPLARAGETAPRRAAIRNLGIFASGGLTVDGGREAIMAAATDRRREIREAHVDCAYLLAGQDPAYGQHLIKLVGDHDLRTSYGALYGIIRNDLPVEMADLRDYLRQPEMGVRVKATELLGMVRSEEALAKLLRALAEPEGSPIPSMASAGLVHYWKHSPEPVLAALNQLFATGSPAARSQAAKTLERIRKIQAPAQ